MDFREFFIRALFTRFKLLDLNLETTEFRAQVGIGTLLLGDTAGNFLTLCLQLLQLVFATLTLSFQFANLLI